MKVKNIIFDMGGVLINLDQQRCMDSFKKLGFKDIETYIDPYTQEGFFSDFETGNMSNEEFFARAKANCRPGVTDEEITSAWNSFLLDIPKKKLDQISELRKNFKTFLLSNTNALHFPWSIT